MRFLLVLLSLTALASAQAPTTTPTDPPKKARISGSIISSTGAPIPRATVRLAGQVVLNSPPPTALSATADDGGQFTIENIEPGNTYTLTAQRPGFVNAVYGARRPNTPGEPLVLGPGSERKDLVITMTPQGVITGRVTDQNNDPAQGSILLALRRGYLRGARQLVSAGQAQINDQGEYRIANLPPGKYYIVAADRRIVDGPAGGAQAGRTGNVTTFYPNSTEPLGAVALDVTPGAELRGIDIRLRRGTVYSARGKVDTAGTAPATVQITAIPKESMGSIFTSLSQSIAQTRAPEYAFEIRNLIPGTYLIQTRTQSVVDGRGVARLGNWAEVTVTDADVTGLVLPLASGPPIKGTVTLEGGDLKTLFPANSTNNASTAIAANLAGVVLNGIRPAIGLVPTIGLPQAAASAQIEENGTFLLEGVSPGKYQLNVASLPQGFYVKSARYAGQEALRTGVNIGASGGGDLAIVLSNKPGEIVGSVIAQDVDSLAAFVVGLWTKNPEPGASNNGVRTAYTDQNGGFRFRNLPPGEYFAAAFEDADPQLVQSRDFLGQFSSEASSVTIQEGGNGTAQAKLISSEKAQAAEAKLP